MIKKVLIGLGIVALSIVVSAATLFVLYNYAPVSLLDVAQSGTPKVGSTITTINGGDTISGSRTTINTNFSNLNSSKLEITSITASSTLTLGTVTTGVWNGTAITVTYGGTGSTTLSANELFVGNGTSNVKSLGWGTSGQFLTSGGGGVLPTWSTASIDTSQAYNWTGLHSFAATTTMATTTMASSTVTNGFNVGANATTTFNGGGINGVYDYQVFTGSGTWNKPANILGTELVMVEAWGAGGGGGASGTGSGGGGGGGGSCIIGYYRANDLTSTVTVTVGTGAAATVGGNTTFGSFLTAYGGGAGQNQSGSTNHSPGGGGGGQLGVGTVGNSDTTGGSGGAPAGSASTVENGGFGGAGGGTGVGARAAYGGGGGGGYDGTAEQGGAAICGGGGGAGGGGAASGGTSVFGGAGGAAVANTIGGTGSAPGGGGGGGSYASGGSKAGGPGGRGEVRVWVYR